MNLYAFEYANPLANSLAVLAPTVRLGSFTWGRFRNDELHVHLNTAASDDCLVLGTIQPPEERLASYLLLCDTLKRHGARSVTAILPYLAYSRQDKWEPDNSLAATWIGKLLQASGVDRVMTLDLHSHRTAEFFPIRLESLSVADLLAKTIGKIDESIGIVAPDEGGLGRAENLRVALQSASPVIHCRKRRTPEGVTSELVGSAPVRAIACDDILDTGNTLVACCERLVEAGCRQISVYVTHGLFTGSAWQRLWDLNVDTITCTDSVPVAPPPDPRIIVIECAPAIAAALRIQEKTQELTHA